MLALGRKQVPVNGLEAKADEESHNVAEQRNASDVRLLGAGPPSSERTSLAVGPPRSILRRARNPSASYPLPSLSDSPMCCPVAGLTQGIADMGRNIGEGAGLLSPSSGTKPSF